MLALMPSFRHYVAVLPLPFRRSVVPCCCTVAVFPFRSSAVAVARENRIAGNVFPLTAFEVRTLIGCPPTAEWQK